MVLAVEVMFIPLPVKPYTSKPCINRLFVVPDKTVFDVPAEVSVGVYTDNLTGPAGIPLNCAAVGSASICVAEVYAVAIVKPVAERYVPGAT
jgi:hypothetical protein